MKRTKRVILKIRRRCPMNEAQECLLEISESKQSDTRVSEACLQEREKIQGEGAFMSELEKQFYKLLVKLTDKGGPYDKSAN